MQVTFHGVRGSTPCDRDVISRYGGNTSCVSVSAPGEDPLLFDLGTGLRYFGLEYDRRGQPFRGTCLLSHLHWDHVQGLPFFTPLRHETSELVIYTPAQSDGRPSHDVLMETICPPLFPIGLHDFPGRIEICDAPQRFRVGGYRVESRTVPHVGETNGYRVSHGGSTNACRSSAPASTS
jgi:phosphoribosyl 1,2-cyclic phosphodiesterase